MKRVYRGIVSFSKLLSRASVTAHAAQAAFFIFLSFFPFVMLLLMILQRWPQLNERLMTLTLDFLPSQVATLLSTVIADIYRSSSSVALISVTAAVTVWSAGKGVIAIIRGLNAVCSVPETRGYFRLRAQAFGYTLLMVVLVIVSLGIIVLGGAAADLVFGWLGLDGTSGLRVRIVTVLLMLGVLLCLFAAMYVFLPAQRQRLGKVWLGALIAAVGWVVFSLVFAIYVERFSNFSLTYGSLTSVVVLMLWLYACMYILFLGATVNELLERAEQAERKKTGAPL